MSARFISVAFLALVVGAAACSASHPTASAQRPNPWETIEGLNPNPSPSLWPSYKALDYRRAQPRLSANEAGHIRRILARVKPCQRNIVYYAYPSNGDANEPIVVFFKGASNEWPHVLAGGNEYFKPEDGDVFPGASGGDYDLSLAADIRNEPCEAELKATPKPPPTRSPIPSLWRSYRALDYAVARPPLSAAEANQVVSILKRVRECQRPYVRYAFANDANESRRFVMFFQSPHDDWPHVLEQKNLYYKKDVGTTFALHPAGWTDFSLSADARSHPCPGEEGPVGATVLGPN